MKLNITKNKTFDIEKKINSPDANPAKTVATIGVLNLLLTREKNLKIRPSEDIAYKILGNGKNEPNILKFCDCFFVNFPKKSKKILIN